MMGQDFWAAGLAKRKRIENRLRVDSIKRMTTAAQLRERMNEHPFRPFRVTLSDGRTLDVPNHDVAFVKRNTIEIGVNLDAQSFGEKYVECAILHITSIEDIASDKAA